MENGSVGWMDESSLNGNFQIESVGSRVRREIPAPGRIGGGSTCTSIVRNFVPCLLRELKYMTSAKFSDFLTPSPPCPQIHATSITKVAYYVCF